MFMNAISSVSVERGRINRILNILSKAYPDAKIALHFSNPLEMLVSTILSAQCNDERVNLVTKDFFKKYKTPEDYAKSEINELEGMIRSTGFYRSKAKNIRNACQIIVEKFDSKVPRTMNELTSLPGIGRKTANIILSNSYGVIEGIAVDTHVARVSKRLGLTNAKEPDKIEQDLMKLIKKELWVSFTYQMIEHGRQICSARKPICNQCLLKRLCPSVLSFE
jgi:endonuclease-3